MRTPSLCFSVTGTSTASRILRRHSPTSSGSRIKTAPKHFSASLLLVTLADGHPALRFTSSYPYAASQISAARASLPGELPPSWTVSGCSDASCPSISGREACEWMTASWWIISVQRCVRRENDRQTARKCASVQSSIGATERRCESLVGGRTMRGREDADAAAAASSGVGISGDEDSDGDSQ